ncbi:MAG: DedA family protein [Actinobacteria bacterium]|nr:DedA family protein [Actinomycetota bacterium]
MTWLSQLDTGSALSYLVAVLLPALDALLPVLPSETAVIALGVATAGSADPRIGVLIGLAAFGAFLGDNAAYLLGRRFGPAASRRLFAGERGARRQEWARRSLDRFGARIIIACRFIPGGRTAVTLSCGLMGYPRRRFVAATACAGAVWACYAFFLGRLGGKAFEDRPWLGLLLALGAAVAIGLLVEAGRRVMQSRQRARRPAGNGEAASTPAPSDPHPGSAAGRYAWNHGAAAGPRPSGIGEGAPR